MTKPFQLNSLRQLRRGQWTSTRDWLAAETLMKVIVVQSIRLHGQHNYRYALVPVHNDKLAPRERQVWMLHGKVRKHTRRVATVRV